MSKSVRIWLKHGCVRIAGNNNFCTPNLHDSGAAVEAMATMEQLAQDMEIIKQQLQQQQDNMAPVEQMKT